MRISAAAVALCLAVTINDTSAKYQHDHRNANSFQSRSRYRPTTAASSLWGIVPNGGDISSSSSAADENADTEQQHSMNGSESSSNANVDVPANNSNSSIKSPSPSQLLLLNSVSAGGGSPSDTAAFVGAGVIKNKSSQLLKQETDYSTVAVAVDSTLKTPAESKDKGSSSSLSVATNQQQQQQTHTESSILQANAKDDKEQQPKNNINIHRSTNNRNNRPLKILFLSSDTGGGHRASAQALASQFQRLYPGTTYSLLDTWSDINSSWPYNTIKETYQSFSSTPWKWRTLYHVSNSAIYAKFVDIHSYYMNEEMVREKILEEYGDVDVVVSVHPTMNYVPLVSVRRISEAVGRDIPFFTVVTDFGSGHCTWFNKDVDKMYLASEPIKQIAHTRGGVPDEKIVMSGLPIRHDFAAQADAMGDRTTPQGKAHQTKIREQLTIDTKKRMILVMGGGEGVGSLSDIVNELYAKLRTQGVDATICVVCGRNEKLKMDLETRCWDTVVSQSLQSYETLKSRFYTKLLSMHAHRSRRIQLALDRAAERAAKGKDVAEVPGNVDVVPLGFTTNMAEYMVAADVLVTKAGPGTIAEAAAVGLPIMATSHLPGQEAGNVDIVLNGGFGDFCEDPETIGLEVACWLQDAQLLDDMSQKAMKVGHPHAAEEIALDIGNVTHEWMERNEMMKKQNMGPP